MTRYCDIHGNPLAALSMSMESGLTGRIRFRTNWFGKVVLQVEAEVWHPEITGTTPDLLWRDARKGDFVYGGENRDKLPTGHCGLFGPGGFRGIV